MTALGLPCGHELVFKPDAMHLWDSDYAGESSWLAAPFLTELDDDVLVLHQRRYRLHAALSMVRHGFFCQGDRYREYAEHWLPTGRGEDVDKALFFYDGWHALIEQGLRGRRHMGYCVEDMDESLLRSICGFLGWPATPTRIYRALQIPRDIHTNREEEAWTFQDSSV